jgi:hypothetical protein
MSRVIVPTLMPITPMRLREDFRDTFGESYARILDAFDRIEKAGCYEPVFFHAPDTETENAGLPINGYLEYMIALPVGGFIVGFNHACTSIDQPFSDVAPAVSGFTVQITDVERAYALFEKPVPETFLLPDRPNANGQFGFDSPLGPGTTTGVPVQLNTPRILTDPYPIAPRGVFKIEFWNQAPAGAFTGDSTDLDPNNLIRLTMLIARPNPDMRSSS